MLLAAEFVWVPRPFALLADTCAAGSRGCGAHLGNGVFGGLQDLTDAFVSAGDEGLLLTAVRCWVGILGRVRSVACGGSRMGVYLGAPVFGGLQEQRFGLPVAACCAV